MDSVTQKTLGGVASLRRRTRRALNPVWFENLITGAYFSVLVGVSALGMTALTRSFAVIGAVMGIAAIVVHAVRRERRLGVEARLADPVTLVAGAMLAGIVGLLAFGSGEVGRVGPFVVAAVGVLAIAALLRDPVEAALGAGLTSLAAVLVVTSPDGSVAWAVLALGVMSLAAGVAGGLREDRVS